MGEIKSLVLVISDINGKCSPKKVFIRGCVCVCMCCVSALQKKRGFLVKLVSVDSCKTAAVISHKNTQ